MSQLVYGGDVPDCEIIKCLIPVVGQHMPVEKSSMTYLGTVKNTCSVGYGIVSGEWQFCIYYNEL